MKTHLSSLVMVGAHPHTALDSAVVSERRSPIRRVFQVASMRAGSETGAPGAVRGSARTPAVPNGKNRGFTLIQLLVVIAIIAILAALLLPALSRAKASSKSAVCKSNLKQISLAFRLYVDDFERYPFGWYYKTPGSNPIMWRDFLLPYCGSNTHLFFACPATRGYPWYGYNSSGTQDRISPDATLGLGPPSGLPDFPRPSPIPESRVLVPSDMIAVVHDAEMGGLLGFGWPGHPWWSGRSFHQGGENGLFCDGHVESEKSELIPKQGTDWWGGSGFKPDEKHAKRWNNDNQPHQETWPNY